MLQLRTFGGLSLQVDGMSGSGAAGQRARVAILAAIAAAGDRGITRDRLYALFWSERDTERARGALSQALFALRRDTGQPELTIGATDLRLNPAVVASDVGEFERAVDVRDWARAVELYAGAFLDGIYLRDAPEFERWVEDRRNRLAERYFHALECLATAAADRQDFTAAVAWWRRRAGADPMNGSAAISLIKALVAAGNRAGAQQHAQVYGALIQQELGGSPDPAIADLVAEIRRAAPSRRDEGTPAPLPAPGHAAAAPLPSATPARRAGRRIILAVATALLAVAVGAVVVVRRPLDPGRVAVQVLSASGRPSGDPLAALVRSDLVAGLTLLGLAAVEIPARSDSTIPLEISPPDERSAARATRKTRARYLVTATIARTGDSVELSAKLHDGEAGLLVAATEPMRVETALASAAVGSVRSRMMALLAARVDPKLASWSSSAALPRNYEGIRLMRLGIDLWTSANSDEAAERFLESAVADPTSATPLLLAALTWVQSGRPREADSLLKVVVRSDRRSGELDRALGVALSAWIRGDRAGGLAAGKRLLALAPRSEWGLLVATDAIALGRAGETVRILRSLDPDRGWLKGDVRYWQILGMGYHLLGDYRGELRAARDGLRRDPNNRRLVQNEVKALVGLGRLAEAEDGCNKTLAVQAQLGWEFQPCGQLIGELVGHGHLDEARRFTELVIGRDTSVADISPVALAEYLIELHSAVGDYQAAEQVLRPLALGRIDSLAPILVATLAAARGDRAEVARLMPWHDTLVAPYPDPLLSYRRAQLASLLGDRAAAVTWLNKAFADGFGFRTALHWDAAFWNLRGDPGFEALAHSVDRP